MKWNDHKQTKFSGVFVGQIGIWDIYIHPYIWPQSDYLVCAVTITVYYVYMRTPFYIIRTCSLCIVTFLTRTVYTYQKSNNIVFILPLRQIPRVSRLVIIHPVPETRHRVRYTRGVVHSFRGYLLRSINIITSPRIKDPTKIPIISLQVYQIIIIIWMRVDERKNYQ